MPWPQNSRTIEKPWPSAMRLDRAADVAEMRAGLHRADAPPHRLVGDFAQPLRLDRRLADVEHAAGVAVKAVLDHGDVDVDDVAGLEPLVAGNAVADRHG